MKRPTESNPVLPSLALILLLPLTACGVSDPRPVPVVYDEDVCSHCRMALSEPSFTAELVTPGGRVEYFDDVGCLADRIHEHPPPEGAGLFVAHYETHTWLEAESAVYFQSPELPTPMSSGLAAFRDRAAAEKLATQLKGRLLTWDEVLEEAQP